MKIKISKEEKDFYDNYEGSKATFHSYSLRIVSCKQEKEYAIQKRNAVNKAGLSVWRIDETGRECGKCWAYKKRSFFYKSKRWLNNRMPWCNTCVKLNRKKRANKNKEKIKEYTKKRDRLFIWEHIIFEEPIIIDWSPRIDERECIDYKKGKGNKIRCKRTGVCKRICLWVLRRKKIKFFRS